MANRQALIIIGRFKTNWNNLAAEEQAAFAARVGRVARKAGVTPMVGYKLGAQGSFLEIWEAEDKATLDKFKQELDALGYKEYYEEVLMFGERGEQWVSPTLQAVKSPEEQNKKR